MRDEIPEHIFIVANTGAVKCGHCGQEYRIQYPTLPEKIVAFVEAFAWLHETCEKQHD